MLVFNTHFKHIKLLSLHLKGFVIKLKNAARYLLTAFLSFTAFACSILFIWLKNLYSLTLPFFSSKLKPYAGMAVKIIVLSLMAFAFTVTVKTYFFQKIMASEMLKIIGDDVSVAKVDLGLVNFSHDSVTIRGLSHSTAQFQLRAKEIDVTYDFIESMKERAQIKILNFKKPVLEITDLKKLAESMFLNNERSIDNYDFLLKLPKISVNKGELSIAGGAWAMHNLNCEITPLTDYIVYIKARADFKNTGCRLELSVTVNFETASVKYSGKINSMSLVNAEKFINALSGRGYLKSSAGEADCEFSGAYSYITRRSESDFKLKPRGCSFVLSDKTETPLLLSEGVFDMSLRTDNFNISDYEISVKAAKIIFNGKEIASSGVFNKSDFDFNFYSQHLSAGDYELITGLGAPAFLKKYAPECSVDLNYKNGSFTAEIKPSPRGLFDLSDLFNVKLAGGHFTFKGSAARPESVSLAGGLSIAINDTEPYEIKISSEGLNDFSYTIAGAAAGSLEFKDDGRRFEFIMRPHQSASKTANKTSLKIEADLDSLKFKSLLQDAGADEIRAVLACVIKGADDSAIKLSPGQFYNLDLSGYVESDRLISHYSLARKNRKQPSAALKNGASPLLNGVFSLAFPARGSSGVSFNLKSGGNLAEALNILDISKLDNYKFYQLIQKKIFNQKSEINLSAENGKLSSLTLETAAIKLDYGFDGKINFEYTHNNFLKTSGIYYINENRLKAGAQLYLNKLPPAFSGAAKYLAVSEFKVDYSEGLLKIASVENKKNGALYFELKTSGIHNIANSKVTLNNVIVETADFSYNGVAEIDFNALDYILKGRLVLNNIFNDSALLKLAFCDYTLNLSGSFRDLKPDEKSVIKARVASAPFLSFLSAVADLKIELNETADIFFEELKITGPAGKPVIKALVELKRDKQLNQNYYYVSYKSEKLKDSILSFAASAAPEYKDLIQNLLSFKFDILQKHIQTAAVYVDNISLSGNLTLKDITVLNHEFEVMLGLKNGLNFLSSFACDDKSKTGYKTKLMNYSFAGVTYKGECAFEASDSKVFMSVKNLKINASDALEFLTGEKIDTGGVMNIDLRLGYESGAFKLSSKIKVSNAKIDVDRLGKMLLKDNKNFAGVPLELNVEIIIDESNYIYNTAIYALAEGRLSVKGTPESPLVSGVIDVVRGKINYLNRSFNIDSGSFKISTLKDVLKPADMHSDAFAGKNAEFSAGDNRDKKSKALPAKTSGAKNEALPAQYSYRLAIGGANNHASAQKSVIELNANIAASTKVDDYDIYLTISAGLNKLSAYLTSKPELSTESIHMLLYGVKPGAASVSGGGEQITSDKFIDVLNTQLQDAIYQKLSDSLEKKFNLDEVRINTYTANSATSLSGRINNKNSGSAELLKNFGHYTDVEVKIGKYIDPALFLSYSKNLYNAKSDSLGMEYKVRKKLMVDGKVNQNLEYRVGAKYGIPF
jgi:hypothetical protein